MAFNHLLAIFAPSIPIVENINFAYCLYNYTGLANSCDWYWIGMWHFPTAVHSPDTLNNIGEYILVRKHTGGF